MGIETFTTEDMPTGAVDDVINSYKIPQSLHMKDVGVSEGGSVSRRGLLTSAGKTVSDTVDRITDSPSDHSVDYRRLHPSRRDFLKTGVVAGLGLATGLGMSEDAEAAHKDKIAAHMTCYQNNMMMYGLALFIAATRFNLDLKNKKFKAKNIKNNRLGYFTGLEIIDNEIRAIDPKHNSMGYVTEFKVEGNKIIGTKIVRNRIGYYTGLENIDKDVITATDVKHNSIGYPTKFKIDRNKIIGMDIVRNRIGYFTGLEDIDKDIISATNVKPNSIGYVTEFKVDGNKIIGTKIKRNKIGYFTGLEIIT